ncbi:bifunctional fructose-1,6-bisphosphatase/inositol-1-monophosphatase [Thermotoga sp. KOL6]|uniref:bifunctional fructose-1,6-bisphosphatase/inositol-1-monophosphatase n=1 Tax=Thermotoga sp. KOL6 TaxID=126741 RepID=UPI000C77F502|nr:bifunctional fructose-1,6-bisphosphatase/inositol-1-monophosphatase [Thermotoga sp. KOL6]PLV60155.1 inositol monophosphatase [Thermotoga sp. KOL6]
MDRLNFSIKLLRRVGHFLMLHWGRVDEVEKKTGFKDIVTKIDKESQEMIVREIRSKFPSDSIMAEEGIFEKGNRLWVIDPIDGTINFVHGLPNFSISIAYIENGEVKMGVVHAPALNETFYAEEGNGAYLNGERINVSKNTNLEECVGSTGSYVDFTGRFIGKMEKRTRRVRILGSAALNACYVGAGRVDFFVTWRINPWDIAAGFIIVKEGGGKITDFAGKEVNVFSKNFIFSNGLIHEEVLKITNEVVHEIEGEL